MVKMYYLLCFTLLLFIFPSTSEAADCPDAAVVVVASVFSTLAVVFIVLGIIAFLIWKRRRGKFILYRNNKPERAKMYLTPCAPSQDSGQIEHPRSLISVRNALVR